MVAYTYYEEDNRVMRYAETLAARGDRVDVIALRRSDADSDAVVNGVNVLKIQTRIRNEKDKSSYASRVLTFLLRAAWIVARRHRRLHYDLIHVHSVPDFLVVAAWLPRLTGAKVILDIHDILPEFYASKFKTSSQSLTFGVLVMVERMSAMIAHHVIIANDLWRRRLVTRSVPEDKCTTILNFPDRSIFHRNGRTRNDGKVLILYPGSLGWHQGLDIAIRAFAKIQDQVPQAEFHIYGQGPTRPQLIDLAHRLGLDNRVFMHESLPLRQIARVMENADLGIVPKRGDSFGGEAFSTKTLEFMSLGVPLIVAATAIDKHYFNDSLVRFFRCGDEDDLAAAMLQLVRDPRLRQQFAHNGLEFAKIYDWETNKGKYLELVDGLTSRRTQISRAA
jgi:glycosyltransferase involved in cell wall biosynthesis